MAKITPMMAQYLELKKEYRHCILFFRLGDFYEMFFEDAMIASKELDITLTGRDWGQTERAPMCGVPFHSAESYIARLIEKGYKVAICEQVETPAEAKGIVKRDVVRVVTPGTVLDQVVLDEKKNNYIMCIFGEKNGFGIAVCDVSTGEFQTSEFPIALGETKILDEVARFAPSEIICNEAFSRLDIKKQLEQRFSTKVSAWEDWTFQYDTASKRLMGHFQVGALDGFGLRGRIFSVCASGGLLEYLYDTQKNQLRHITAIKFYAFQDFMLLDVSSRRNLELTETLREKEKKGSLLWVLDKTKTAMGARLLRKWVEQPLVSVREINLRLDSVEELKDNGLLREEVKDALQSIVDLQRILGRIVYQTANARDLVALQASIEKLPFLKEVIRYCKSEYLKDLYTKLDPLTNVYALLDKAIVAEPPFSVREGGMIKMGFSSELDVFLRAKSEGSAWMQELEEEEKEKTGIKNLKVRFNKVFGYYIEVTKGNLSMVPERYVRKQTLANCERFITSKLNELAEVVLGAEEKIVALEYKLFCQIRDAVAAEVQRIQKSADITSVIDGLQSLAEVAFAMHYTKPVVTDGDKIDIKEGRHPVVEKIIGEQFIPNDTFLDGGEHMLSIITGPNMAGKSTYMRQTALIVLMAQMGSFVPASSAQIGVCDRIYTRVGASDDLSSGQSTFMVEMTEVANILHGATKKSLLILDEIGRGTSTFDGLSIAWAVLEYIVKEKNLGAKTLFATHYHELTELEGNLYGVKNYCIMVEEKGEDVLFLRKIKRGGADNSYGIQVAKLAGLPKQVIKRSREILTQLGEADIAKQAKKMADGISIPLPVEYLQERQLVEKLSALDVMAMTPIEALQVLFDFQKKAKEIE